MSRRLTALQYQQLIQRLPNPMTYYYDNNKEKRIRIAYLDKYIISLNFTDEYISNTLPILTLDFELVLNENIFYWEPVEEIIIEKINK